MASCLGTVVEQYPHHPAVKCLSSVVSAGALRDKSIFSIIKNIFEVDKMAVGESALDRMTLHFSKQKLIVTNVQYL